MFIRRDTLASGLPFQQGAVRLQGDRHPAVVTVQKQEALVFLDPLGPDHWLRGRHQHRSAMLISHQNHAGAEPLHQCRIVGLADFSATVVGVREHKDLILIRPFNPYRHGEVPFAT
ncbi:hypothetical protein D3C84_839930 [compost metagenome]